MNTNLLNGFMAGEMKLTYRSNLTFDNQKSVQTTKQAIDVLRTYFDVETIELKEFFKVLLLNAGCQVIGCAQVAEGGLNRMLVDVKNIFQVALLGNAASIIVAHNHPSGSVRPSMDDIELTEKIKRAGQLLQVQVDDHIIMTKDSYFSFNETGLILGSCR